MFFGQRIWETIKRMSYKNRRMVVCKHCESIQKIPLDSNVITKCSICGKVVEPKVTKDREKTNG